MLIPRGVVQFNTVAFMDSVASARSAGLVYTSDDRPGIRRLGKGKRARYVDARGKPVRGRDELARIRALVIPPAWTDVWICPNARGHLQATGRDARGRKQYRYHAKWRTVRDGTKFGRMISFGHALPAIRRRTDADLRRPGLPREKVLAAVVRLLEKTFIRVGNDEYARDNRSFGLTTMRDGHVRIAGSTVKFIFRGKSGVEHALALDDKRLAKIVRQCRDLPGQDLFQYHGPKGRPKPIGSADVNAYIRKAAGAEFSAKDFRTWAGTVKAASKLAALSRPETKAATESAVCGVIKEVASELGNTPTVCRKSYVHPVVLEAFAEGEFPSARATARLSAAESRVLRLLADA